MPTNSSSSSAARGLRAADRRPAELRQREGRAAARRRSPARSSPEQPGDLERAAEAAVRPRPRPAAGRSARRRTRSSPASARMVPSIRLNSVVLPEPLGPISAVIEPSGTVNEQPSTAAGRRSASQPRHLQQRRGRRWRAPSATATCSRSDSRLPPVSMRAPDQPGLALAAAPRSSKRSPRLGRMPCGRNITTSHQQPAEQEQPRVAAAEVRCWHDLVERLDQERAEHRPPQRAPAAEQQRQDDLDADQDVNIPSGSMKVR